MNATHAHELNSPTPDVPPRGHSTSPWLWAALVLAILIGVVTLVRRHDDQAPVMPVGSETAPAVLPSAVDAPAAARESTAARSQRKPAPLVRDRQARPLAGNAAPAYPPAALRAGVEGSVVASLQVDAQGKVSDASIVSHAGERSRDLDRAVLNAVRSWTFEPAMRDGRTVASVVRVPVDFRTER